MKQDTFLSHSGLHRAILFGAFILLLCWWFSLHFLGDPDPFIDREAGFQLWASSYQIIAIFGTLVGVRIARFWGGAQSIFGKALILFSLGLLFQSFGQTVYSIYIYTGREVPYPSFGDLGYFGSILWYIAGAFYLARAVGMKISLSSLHGRFLALILPLGMLVFSYFVFLRGYEADWASPLTVFLDFGYPLGQSVYVSLAILTFLLSRSMLGGFLRTPALMILFALVVQYIADYMFLFQSSRGTWYAGGLNDLVYLFSYTLMAASLIEIGTVFHRIRSSA